MLVVYIFNGDNNNNNSGPTFMNKMWRVVLIKMGTFHCIVLCWGPHSQAVTLHQQKTTKKTSAAEKRRTFLAQQLKFKSPVKNKPNNNGIFIDGHIFCVFSVSKHNLYLVCLLCYYRLFLWDISSKEQSKDEPCCRFNLHVQTVFVGLSKQVWAPKRNKRLWEAGNEKKQACIRVIMIVCESKHWRTLPT